MSIELELPNLGEGVSEADVAEILVSVGDVIEAGQNVMELETDKAVLELPCPHAGTIEKILVKSGDTVQVGSKLLVISSENGESSSAPEKTSSSSEEKASEPQQEKAPQAESKPAAEQSSSDEKNSSESAQTASETEIVDGEIEFALPPLGEGVASADVAEILVSEGDVITAEQVVMELETEKAVVELPCPHAGKIKKILVSEGASVSVGSPVLVIEATSKVGGQKPASKPAAPKQEQPQEAKKEAPAPAPESKPASAEPIKGTAVISSSAASESSKTEDSGNPAPAAPSTRRLARQLGVDLREVIGSARGGRITQEDVQAYVRDRMKAANLPAKAAAAGTTVIAGGSLAPPPLPDFTKFGQVSREKMSKIGRTAAENLTVSWNVIPHVTQHDRVDITDLEAARKRFANGMGKNGPKVTMTALVMKALAKCLQAYPKFNSSLDPETNEIVFKHFYHIGCAVDTPNGLLVPVIRDCDKKSILEIAQELGDLAAKARDRKLSIDSMQGATCTVTNLGGIGGVAFTPIVNYPEVCILGMSRGQQELKLIDGKVEERLILPLSLSYDHRVINGADAARFVATLGGLLSDPFQLLTTV